MLITLYLTDKKRGEKRDKKPKIITQKRGKNGKFYVLSKKTGIILRQAIGCLTRILFKEVGSAN
jgi:hypothetical protein